MRVFVGIDVSEVDTSTLELLNLRQRLALDVVFADGSTDQGLDKIDKRWPEGLAIRAEERGDTLGGGRQEFHR